MINKTLIHDRFSKSLESYHKHARIQKRMAERLFSFIQNKKVGKILEIGAGTGFLTEIVNKNIDFKKYVAIDIVEKCEGYVKEINPDIEFLAIDVEDFVKQNDETFDLIISNATLQWVENFEEVINSLKNKLNSGGEFIFSTFGNENFREIYHVVGTSLNYYSINELENLFSGAEICPEIHIMAFESPKDVLKHLQLTGVNGIENKNWTRKDLIKFENGYKNLCNNRATLTYNPIYIKIK